MSQDNAIAFIEYVVKGIVKEGDKVVISKEETNGGVCLNIQVDGEDMGRLIGKNGQTAKAIRTLLRLIGVKNGLSVTMKILDPATSITQ